MVPIRYVKCSVLLLVGESRAACNRDQTRIGYRALMYAIARRLTAELYRMGLWISRAHIAHYFFGLHIEFGQILRV